MVIASAFVVVPARVEAFEVSGGVSVGGIVAGTVPRLALSPHASIAWPLGGGFLFVVSGELGLIGGLKGLGGGLRFAY